MAPSIGPIRPPNAASPAMCAPLAQLLNPPPNALNRSRYLTLSRSQSSVSSSRVGRLIIGARLSPLGRILVAVRDRPHQQRHRLIQWSHDAMTLGFAGNRAGDRVDLRRPASLD